jgi:citrate synthase
MSVGAAAKYELTNPLTHRAAELNVMSGTIGPDVLDISHLIYSALGIPRSMFTVMFAIARTAGWVAHWQEMVSDPHMKIGRPRQLYTGPARRAYRSLEERLA